jgi:hypothetical protein
MGDFHGELSNRDILAARKGLAGTSARALLVRRLARCLPLLVGLSVIAFAIQISPQLAVATKGPTFQASPLTRSETHPARSSGASTLYLPLILEGPQPPPVLLGVYSTVYIANQQMVDQYLIGLDAWAGLNRASGRGHSIWGDFVSFEVPNPSGNVYSILQTPWSNGYTTFVNLSTSMTAAQIVAGEDDVAIQAWAQAYKNWVSQSGIGENRRAFIAPLQEMNGDWTPYGCHPTDYRNAYQHIQDVFASAGVTRSQVWWVFAPNGWTSTSPGCASMPAYYPGDDKVDVIAFSAYNFGFCSVNQFPAWQDPTSVFGPYITLIRQQITPNRPIFIAETGVTSSGGNKDQWLRDAYTYLTQQNVRAILYFDSDKECDWAVYTPDGVRQVPGYRDAVVSSPRMRYIAPSSLSTFTFTP